MPAKKKLKTFGKNRREVRAGASNGGEGAWPVVQHQDKMRQIQNPLFDRYYNELQQLGSVVAQTPPLAVSGSSSSAAPAAPEGSGVAAKWQKEMELFRTPLGTTLWINDTDPLASEVRAYFESLDASLVQPIPWYPIPGMGWRILADKTEFRKRQEMQQLRQYLIQQTALGTISRQEEVSMIPPFLLDIQPNDVCLDMCASPGSKTAQLLVALGREKVPPLDSPACPFPFDYSSGGLVVANELDTKRANMLVHQVRRMRLLFPFALFTNHDARYFPEIPMGNATTTDEEKSVLRFDKILCDVVCSGDGTLRKAPHIFKVWSPKEGMNLQKLQIQIALRACHLLKIGGRLVYSTCSLNPIENEAVVAQIVHRTRGAMKLVDARSLLPHLPSSPGMWTWTVTDIKGNIVPAPEGNMHEALFPPNTPGGYSSAAVNGLDLSKCMRLFPSHCNGGGFFIAVLDKVDEFRLVKRDQLPAVGVVASSSPAKKERKEAEACLTDPVVASETVETNTSSSAPIDDLAGKGVGGCTAAKAAECEEEEEVPPVTSKPKPIPPQFVAAPLEIQNTIRNFYEVPTFPMELLFVRTAHGERELRLSQGSICSIVSSVAAEVLRHKTDQVMVVSVGLRLLAFESLDRGWRIASESALLFGHLMAKSSRMVTVDVAVVLQLIRHGGKLKERLFEDFEDVVLRQKLEDLSVGTVLLKVMAPKAVHGVWYCPALRARSRLQLLVDHEDLDGLQLRLGETPIAPVAADTTTALEGCPSGEQL